MKVPLEIKFRGLDPSEFIKRLVEEKVAKLEHLDARLISCHVAIERVQESHHKGNPYRVRIDLLMPPGHELVIREESAKGQVHDSLPQLVRNAFRSAQRQLTAAKERLRHDVKKHIQAEAE
ncbi:MAG: HPF/RaiA family ribosome-associated protein [Candidatus Omnitrophica bacterium]|nr:HPF/RaiA family ribosome-associated protein [Candidatus Omnitrophota bacterium]